MAQERNTDKGVSLAKGPVGITGIVLLAAGILGLLFAGHSFNASHAVSGTANGGHFLGFEGNGWTWALTGVAGLLLMFGAPMHWAAKSMSLIVGLALGAASVIALVDKHDVFGLAAANGPTKLLWGAAASLLLVLALLPRVGKNRKVDDDRAVDYKVRERRPVEREVVRERPVEREVEREPRGEVVDRDVTRGEHVRDVDRRDGDLRGDREVVVERDRGLGTDDRGGAVSPDRRPPR